MDTACTGPFRRPRHRLELVLAAEMVRTASVSIAEAHAVITAASPSGSRGSRRSQSKERRVSEIGWIFFAVGAGIFIILLDISTRLIRANRLLASILEELKSRN